MRSFICLCALLAVLWTPTTASVKKLPPYLKTCSRNDPNLYACALKHTIDAVPSLAKGDPTLNIPVLDPLLIERVVVTQGTGPVSFQLTLDQLNLYGLKDVDLHAMDFDLKNKVIVARFTIPGQNAVIKSKYTIDGKVLILPIKGDGDMTLTLDTVNATFTSDFELVKQNDGLDHIKLKNNSFDFNIKRAFLNFQNLFNGDKTLGDNMNLFLNENWQEVFKEIKPTVAEVVRVTLVNILTQITAALPYDVMFPE